MPILDELRARGLEIKFSSVDEDEIRICCPFCVEMGTSPDYKFRCGINLRNGLGHCYNCEWKSQKAFLEVIRIFGLDPSIKDDLSWTRETRKRAKPVFLPEDFQLLSECEDDDPVYEQAIRYCYRRGVTRRQFKLHTIGASTADWQWGYRILFPIRNEDGLLLGYQGRDWTGQNKYKAMNTEGTKAIWNGKRKHHSSKMGIMSEGIFKALAIERATGYRYMSAASLGHNLTDESMGYAKGIDELILFPDPDKAGMNGYINLSVRYNTHFKRISVVWPWPDKQADEMKPEEIRERLRNRQAFGFALRQQLKLEMIIR